MEKQPYIVGIGAANLDIMGRSKAPLVPEDSNPGRIHVSVGGATHNACENAARLGVPVKFITTVGDDHFGHLIRSACEQAGMDTSRFITFPGEASSTYMSVHNQNGEMNIAVSDMSILQKLTGEQLLANDDLLRNASAIVFDTGLPQDIIDLLKTTYGEVTPIFADTVSTTYARKLARNLQGIDTLKPNLLEAEVLSGMEIRTFAELREAAKALIDGGVRRVVISLGPHGAYYRDAAGTERYRVAKAMSKIVNVTGAGDSFLGALLYAKVRSLGLEDTLATAMTVSMLTIQSESTIHPMMSEALVNENRSLAEEDTSFSPETLKFKE